jgi:hypothetical protein
VGESERAALNARLLRDLTRPGVVEKYWAHVVRDLHRPELCWIWTGAIADKGHGRLRIGEHVYLAHRIGWALAHPGQPVPELLAHDVCDLPPCQNPAHTVDSNTRHNTGSWAARLHTPGSAGRDTRGARGRSRAVRDAARAGLSIEEALAAGLSEIDRNQGTLW